MRARIAIAVLACGGLVTAGIALAADSEPPPPGRADGLSLKQLVGQRIVTGYVGARPSGAVLRAVRRGEVGGVILFQNNLPSEASARRSIRKLQNAARSGGQPYLFVMIDQEGGQVKRLPKAPPDLSPRQIGRRSNVASVALREGRATGKHLRKLGFNVDLAPVADVPSSASSFLGSRAFSRDRAKVAAGACAFANGLESEGVAAAFKHFPGLGRASINTDDGIVRIDATAAQIKADLTAYRKCPDAASLTMLSSARYPRLGSNRPAVLTPVTQKLLSETGFRGLTISDAFETPAIVAQRSPDRRAIRVGLDIVLYGQALRRATRAHMSLLADVRAGRLRTADLRASAAEILQFKDRLTAGKP